MGAVLADQRKLDEAVAAYRKAIELNPRLANSYIGLATALRVQGKRDEAAAAYWKVIELSPQLASTHIKVGTYFSDDLNDYAAALVCFRKAIELDPKSAAAYAKLGTALVGQGKLDEGIVNFRKALELDPKSADPYCHLSNTHGRLAHALQTQGKFEEAIASYGAGLAADPQSAWTYNGLAWLLATCREVRLRDPARAAVLARRAVELAPENADYFNTLGVAEYRAGNWQAAVEALTKSVSLRGDRSVEASDWFFLAMAHWQLGNNDEARRWFDRGVGWMELTHSTSAQLTRFRAEAAELLGVDPKTRQAPATAPATSQASSTEE